MGCSNPHPHCQVWAGTALPNEPAKRIGNRGKYWDAHHVPLLVEYSELEQSYCIIFPGLGTE